MYIVLNLSMGYDINTFTMSFIRNKVATFNGKSYKRKGHLYLIKIEKKVIETFLFKFAFLCGVSHFVELNNKVLIAFWKEREKKKELHVHIISVVRINRGIYVQKQVNFSDRFNSS